MRNGIISIGLLALAAFGCDDTSGTKVSSSALCTAYCTTIMSNCKGNDADAGTSARQQYSNMTNCLNTCKAFPVGATTDTSGNTLGCRTYHAMAAAMDPVLHCPHAGPGGAGVCGTNCDGYCQIAMMYCTAANSAKVYTDLADCKATCAAKPDDVKFNVGIDSGSHVACLLFHAQEASTVPVEHCTGDLDKTSTTCQ